MRVGTGTLSGCVTCEGGRGRGGQVDKLDIRTSWTSGQAARGRTVRTEVQKDRVKKDNRKIFNSSDQ